MRKNTCLNSGRVQVSTTSKKIIPILIPNEYRIHVAELLSLISAAQPGPLCSSLSQDGGEGRQAPTAAQGRFDCRHQYHGRPHARRQRRPLASPRSQQAVAPATTTGGNGQLNPRKAVRACVPFLNATHHPAVTAARVI
jgi:hypothetical protein